jgi:hypothetical protein
MLFACPNTTQGTISLTLIWLEVMPVMAITGMGYQDTWKRLSTMILGTQYKHRIRVQALVWPPSCVMVHQLMLVTKNSRASILMAGIMVKLQAIRRALQNQGLDQSQVLPNILLFPGLINQAVAGILQSHPGQAFLRREVLPGAILLQGTRKVLQGTEKAPKLVGLWWEKILTLKIPGLHQ